MTTKTRPHPIPPFFKTKAQAMQCVRAARKSMPNPKDWKIRVWENPERIWRVSLRSGPIALYYSGNHWSVMIAGEPIPRYPGSGDCRWQHLCRRGATPLVALKRTAPHVTKRIRIELQNLQGVQDCLAKVLKADG